MILPFDEIADDSKLWIFPSSRKFYPQELAGLNIKLEDFFNTWKNEGAPLTCSYRLIYDRFIVIAVDTTLINLTIEAHDQLSDFIQQLEQEFSILLMDKINVCYKQGEFVQYKDIKDFRQLIKNKGVSPKTTVFNNMITTKEELSYLWEINIMDSWLSHLIPKKN
jgi:hypothetical protein